MSLLRPRDTNRSHGQRVVRNQERTSKVVWQVKNSGQPASRARLQSQGPTRWQEGGDISSPCYNNTGVCCLQGTSRLSGLSDWLTGSSSTHPPEGTQSCVHRATRRDVSPLELPCCQASPRQTQSLGPAPLSPSPRAQC